MDKINFQNLPSTEIPIDADNLNKIQDNVESSINDVDTRVDSMYKILWENSDPDSEFTGNQTINLSSDDYDMLIWFYKRDKDVKFIASNMIPKGWDGYMGYVNTYGGQNSAYREAVRHSDTKFLISAAFKGGTELLAAEIIPLQVVGIKYSKQTN